MTTAKVLRSVIANKPLVTADWLSASKKADAVLDIGDYIHEDFIATDRSSLFAGRILFFTSAPKTSFGADWDEIVQFAKKVGATSVESGSATTGHDITPKERVLLLGVDKADKDVKALIWDHERVVYMKTMLARTILAAAFAPEASRITLDT